MISTKQETNLFQKEKLCKILFFINEWFRNSTYIKTISENVRLKVVELYLKSKDKKCFTIFRLG